MTQNLWILWLAPSPPLGTQVLGSAYSTQFANKISAVDK